MDETIFDNYCKLVKKGDSVYHLGDVAFSEEAGRKIRKLPGQKYLIIGNHDQKFRRSLKDWGFNWVKDVYNLRINPRDRNNRIEVWLSHYAHRVWPKKHYGTYHAHGHSHGALPFYEQSADVGVDNWEFYPVSLESLIQFIDNDGDVVRIL